MANIAVSNNLFTADEERIRNAVMRRFSPLDGIGKDLQSCNSYSEALEQSGLGFTPVVERLQPVGIGKKKIPGWKAIYNGDDCLHIVKDDYTVVSNEEAFQIADDLVKNDGFRYCVSNIRKNGARCRLVLYGPSVDILGEEYTPYVILNNSFDLSRSVSVQFMFLRLVCLNGLMRKAPHVTSSITLAHFGEKDTKLQRLSQFRENFEKTLTYLQKEAQVFLNTPMTQEEFRKEILPLLVEHQFQRSSSTTLTDRQQARTQSFIESCLSAYDSADTQQFNGTAYKVLLTMTDLDSHLAPFINRSNPDVYINRVLQTETLMSFANLVGNYIIRSRKLSI